MFYLKYHELKDLKNYYNFQLIENLIFMNHNFFKILQNMFLSHKETLI